MMKTPGDGALCPGRAQASSLAPLLRPRPNHPMPGTHKATAGEPQPLRALGLTAGPRSPWRGTLTPVLIPHLEPQASPARASFFLCLPPPPGGVGSPGPALGLPRSPWKDSAHLGGRRPCIQTPPTPRLRWYTGAWRRKLPVEQQLQGLREPLVSSSQTQGMDPRTQADPRPTLLS